MAPLIISAVFAVTACGPRTYTRGYIIDPQIANAITPGVDNQQSVISTLGTPTVISNFHNNRWYYISTRLKRRTLFYDTPFERRVFQVSFDDGGNVADVTNYTLADARSVSPSSDTTPTRGRELNFFQEIFQGLGQFGGAGAGPGGGGPGGPR